MVDCRPGDRRALLRRTRAVSRRRTGSNDKAKGHSSSPQQLTGVASGRAQPPKRERPSSKGKAENDELRLLTQLHTGERGAERMNG